MFSKLAVDTFETSFSYDKEKDLLSVKADDEFKKSLEKFSNNLFHINGLIQYFPFTNACIAGGSLNLLLDKGIKDIDKNVAMIHSDIDIYIYGTSNPRKVVEGIIGYIYSRFQDENMYVGFKGSVIYIWSNKIGRIVQLCIMSSKYNTICDIISDFDLDHIKVAYDGNYIYYKKDAIKSMQTRKVIFKSKHKRNQLLRVFKANGRGYKVYDNYKKLINLNNNDIKNDKNIINYKQTRYPFRNTINEEELQEHFELLECINLTKSYKLIGLTRESLELNQLLNKVKWSGFNSMNDDEYYGVLDKIENEISFDLLINESYKNKPKIEIIDLNNFVSLKSLKNTIITVPFMDISIDPYEKDSNDDYIHIQFDEATLTKVEILLNYYFNDKDARVNRKYESFNKIRVQINNRDEEIKKIQQNINKYGHLINLIPLYSEISSFYYFKLAKYDKPTIDDSKEIDKFNKCFYLIKLPLINIMESKNKLNLLRNNNLIIFEDAYIDIETRILFKSIIKKEIFITYALTTLKLKHLDVLNNLYDNIIKDISGYIEYDDKNFNLLDDYFEDKELLTIRCLPILDSLTGIIKLKLILIHDKVEKETLKIEDELDIESDIDLDEESESETDMEKHRNKYWKN